MKKLILSGFLCGILIYNISGHICKWRLCPYKNSHGTSIVTDQFGDDTFEGKLDLLHLEYPKMEYDQLDSLVNTILCLD